MSEPDAQLLQIPLGGGLDETTDDAHVPFTALRTATNVVFPAKGVLAKRQGLTSLAGGAGTAPTGSRKLFERQGEVLISDGVSAWAYVPAKAAFVNRGSVSPCMLSRALLASGNAALAAGNAASKPIVPLGSQAEDGVTKLRVYAWCDGVSTNVSVFDTASQQYVMTETQLNPNNGILSTVTTPGASQYRPRVVIINSVAFIFYGTHSGADFTVYRAIDLTAATLSITGETTVNPRFGGSFLGLFTTGNFWDVCVVYPSGTPLIVLACVFPASSQSVLCATFSISGTTITGVGMSAQNINTFPVAGLGVAATANGEASQQIYLAIGYGLSSTTFALGHFVFTPSLTTDPTLIGSGTLDNDSYNTATYANQTGAYRGIGVCRNAAVGTGSTTSWILTWTVDTLLSSGSGTGTPTTINQRAISSVRYAITTSAGSFTPVGFFHGFQTVSKPVQHTANGAVGTYALLEYSDGYRAEVINGAASNIPAAVQNGAQTLLLVQLSTSVAEVWQSPKPIGVASPRFAGNAFAGNSDVCIASDGTGLVFIGTETDAALNTSLSALRANFQDVNLWQSAELGNWVYLAGGLPMIYDGTLLCEVGFNYQPVKPTVGFGSSGSVIPAISTLQYCVVFTQQDVNGNVHRSPPSNVVTVDATAGYASTTLAIVPYVMTYRQQTQASSAVIGINPVKIEIYRNNSGAGQTVLQLIATIPNDATTGGGNGYVTFTDTTPDAAGVTTAPVLYTSGGVVPSDGPPSLSALTVHADRVFGISPDGQTCYFTTDFTPGEAPRFTDSFTITWPQGPITAQWSIESRLHAATAGSILYVYGDGPTPTGAGNDLTPAQEWQNDLGVPDTRCVADCQIGTLLWTSRGLYLEGRDGSFSWIGERCQRTLGATGTYQTVTSVVPLVADGVARITGTTATIVGGIIHWDYRRSQFALHLPASQEAIQSAVVANGVWYGLRGPNLFSGAMTLVKEDASTNLDDSVWVTATVATGWATPAGLQGFLRLHRIVLLASQNTPGGLSLAIARDYSSAYDTDVGTWTDSDLSGESVVQVQLTASPQKCEAFAVKVTDAAPATLGVGKGAGFSLKMLLARARGKRGEFKQIPNNQRR